MSSASLTLASPIAIPGERTGALTPEAGVAVLDQPDAWEQFSRPQPGHTGAWESHIMIEGMHCAACALTIEDALRSVPGVIDAQVSAGSHRARVVWDAAQSAPSTWFEAVCRAGYRAIPAQDADAEERRRRASRASIWRWLVAGFCMMQVMMYAWPAYVAVPGDLSVEMEQLLRWASWVLTLPVILFSCRPFFEAAWRDVRRRQISMDLPVALGMLVTFLISTAGTFEPQGRFGHEVYFDSLTMFVFFLLTGRWLEHRLRVRTAGALDALMNRIPDSVERRGADGNFERVPVRRLRAGDVIRVLPGEAFAADGCVEEGATQVDEALLTGESHPLPRGVGARVIAGSFNLSAPVVVRIDQVGPSTRYSQIVALMETAALSRPDVARLADRLARPFLVGVLLAACGAAAWWWSRSPEHALMVAVSVLVVTCPCALSLATPAALLASAGRLAREGVLVRRLSAFESLAQADTVVFDKTGTLTQDALALRDIRVRAGMTPQRALALACVLAQTSRHPLSRALCAAGATSEAGVATEVREVAGQGLTGRLTLPDGAVLALRLGSLSHCGVAQAAPDLPHVVLADDAGWIATFEFDEALRPDALQTVEALRAQGLSVCVLSGDSPASVQRVAAQLGIVSAQGGCTPQDKLQRLRDLQRQGHRVVVVGDGINDGPALAGAQVSFALGQAVPLAQAQSDFVVLGQQLVSVSQALALSRRALRIVRQNLLWAVVYNAACIPLAVLGLLPAWLAGLGMASSSLLVVLNALRLAPVSRLNVS